jgi:hypothetical protein
MVYKIVMVVLSFASPCVLKRSGAEHWRSIVVQYIILKIPGDPRASMLQRPMP